MTSERRAHRDRSNRRSRAASPTTRVWRALAVAMPVTVILLAVAAVQTGAISRFGDWLLGPTTTAARLTTTNQSDGGPVTYPPAAIRYILDTPFQLLLLYFPFSLLSDPATARAIYTLILEWALFALAVVSLRLTDWEMRRWFGVLFFFFCVTNFYAFQLILEATPVIVLGLFFAGILFALRYEQDEMAGALMAVSLYYWEVGLPFLLLVGWYAYKMGRTRILAGFGMFSFLFLAVSFLIFPNWLLPYLRAGMNNLRADFGYSIFSTLTHLLPSIGNGLSWLIVFLLLVILGYEWNLAVQKSRRAAQTDFSARL